MGPQSSELARFGSIFSKISKVHGASPLDPPPIIPPSFYNKLYKSPLLYARKALNWLDLDQYFSKFSKVQGANPPDPPLLIPHFTISFRRPSVMGPESSNFGLIWINIFKIFKGPGGKPPGPPIIPPSFYNKV